MLFPPLSRGRMKPEQATGLAASTTPDASKRPLRGCHMLAAQPADHLGYRARLACLADVDLRALADLWALP
jgi:hypothetical protein